MVMLYGNPLVVICRSGIAFECSEASETLPDGGGDIGRPLLLISTSISKLKSKSKSNFAGSWLSLRPQRSCWLRLERVVCILPGVLAFRIGLLKMFLSIEAAVFLKVLDRESTILLRLRCDCGASFSGDDGDV